MAQGHRSRDGHGGLRRTVLVLGTIALVVGALLIAMTLGALAVAAAGAPAPSPAATSTGTATDDDAEQDAAPDPAVVDRACALADARLARADTEGAHALLGAAGITDDNAEAELDADCLTTWTLAAPAAPASDAKGMPERVGSGWDAFVKTTFTPLAAAAGFVVGGWLALFVLARLLVELPRMRDLTSDRASRRRAAWLGWLLLATTPIAAVLVGANAATLGALAPLMLGGIAILAGVAVVALCAWLATVRVLRIEVTAPDADDEGKRVTSALVAARLRQLTEKSGRIDLPAGPSISGLGDALKDFSSNRAVAAVQKIVLFLIGVTPWVATAVVASGTRATLTIARNSSAGWVRAVSTTGDGWEPLAKPPAKSPVAASDFLSVVIAAEVLLALAERYPDDFESGLYGATKGRSVALQFIAIEWFATRLDTSDAETLLATALRIDPRNDLARYSLAYVQHRHATDTDELVAFGETLDRWIEARAGSAGGGGAGAGAGADAGFGGAGDERAGDELLRAMMFARAAAARNLAANVLARRLAGTPPVKRPTGVFDAADAVVRRWDAAVADLEARADRARAITALDRSRRSLTHLIARVDEDDAPLVERLRFGRAVLTRARMILRNDEPLPRTEPDVDGALARARVRIEGLRAPAEAEVRRARLALRDADRAVTLVAASGATQSDRDAALAARAGAASALERAESALEAVGDDLEALDVVQGALRDDLYTADAALAYSLTTALVCWERQRMDAPVVARTLDVSVRVPVIREFAVTDPELATAEDFARWKARFRRSG